MSRTDEELNLLAKLASKALDGLVGDVLEYRGYKSVFCGKYIENGEPVSYRQGESERFFNGKENEQVPGRREEEHFDTDASELSRAQCALIAATLPNPRKFSSKNPSGYMLKRQARIMREMRYVDRLPREGEDAKKKKK